MACYGPLLETAERLFADRDRYVSEGDSFAAPAVHTRLRSRRGIEVWRETERQRNDQHTHTYRHTYTHTDMHTDTCNHAQLLLAHSICGSSEVTVLTPGTGLGRSVSKRVQLWSGPACMSACLPI